MNGPIEETIASVRALFRRTAITAALCKIVETYDCFDNEACCDEDSALLLTYDDFAACDMMDVQCCDKQTGKKVGAFRFIPDNGASPAEDFCDWTCGNKDFDASMESITRALDFEC